MRNIFSKMIFNILKNCMNFVINYHFYKRERERVTIEKVEKLITNLHDQTEYVIQIRNLKNALNHGLVLKKVHRVIKFNQTAWLKKAIYSNG